MILPSTLTKSMCAFVLSQKSILEPPRIQGPIRCTFGMSWSKPSVPLQARQSQLSRRFGGKARKGLAEGGSELALTHGIRDSGDIEMSLMVRAARNLPIRLLAKEYERILKRRLRVVGGSPNDPALRAMLQHFRCLVLTLLRPAAGTTLECPTLLGQLKEHTAINSHLLESLETSEMLQRGCSA